MHAHSTHYKSFYTGLFEDNTLFSDPANDPITTASSQQSSPPLMTSNLGLIQQCDEVRPEELPSTPDVIECEQFHVCTCGCDKDQGNPCSKQFPLEHYIERRAQCSFLTKDELDLVLMGFISSAILDSEAVIDGRHQNPAKRRRITMGYKHHGKDVCRKTFLFLHGIGKDRLQNVKDHYKEEGLQTRIHKNTKRSLYHAMPFDATSYV